MAYNSAHSSSEQGSGTTQSGNSAPTAPTVLAEQNLTPDLTPDFRAQYNDPDVGDIADFFQIEVRDADSGGGTLFWDSTKTSMANTTAGTNCPWITYAGTALVEGTAYYWRIKFWDDQPEEGAWSATGGAWKTFTLVIPPVIANVTPVQRTDGSQIVDITYDLSDVGDGGPFTVSLEFSDDGGGGYVACTTVGGHVGAGVTAGVGKVATWTIGTDDPNKDDTDYRIRVKATDTLANLGQGDSANFSIDTLDPTAPGNFTFNARTGTTITLNFGAVSTEADFADYKLWYLLGNARPDNLDTEFDHGDLNFINYNGSGTIQVTGLTAGQWYSFLLICHDNFGNTGEQVAHLEATTNSGPTVAFVSPPAQKTDGTQLVDVELTVDDFNDDPLIILVEYATGAGGPWNKCTLNGAPTLGYGTADNDNAQTYQIGNVDAVETTSGPNTVSTDWDAGTDVPASATTYWMRATLTDGLTPTNSVTAASFTVDTLDPANVSLVLDKDPPDALDTTAAITSSWTESNPDVNEVSVRIDGGAYTHQLGTVNTATPGSTIVTMGTVYGDEKIEIRGRHNDDFGNETITVDATNYFVKPATPAATTVAVVTAIGADVTPIENAADAAGISPTVFEHAIFISGPGGGWVNAAGAIVGAEVWQTKAVWGTKTVTGLTSMTAYTAASKTRNPNDTAVESDLSVGTAFVTTSIAPAMQNVTVSPPADGSKIYTLEADIQDADNSSLTVTWLYSDGGPFAAVTTIAGDTGVVAGVPAPAAWKHITATWNAGIDEAATEDAAGVIRLQIEDAVNTVTGDSSSFIMDTKDPTLTAVTLTDSEVLSTSARMTWSAAATEGNHDTYELYVSTVSPADAFAKNGIQWDDVDDATLGTKATVTTVITGLAVSTPYFVALFAKDIRGNYSVDVVLVSFTSGSNYIITGRAIDQNGYLIPGATATAYLASTGALVASDTTTADGLYSISVTSAGPYFIVVAKTGYGSYVEDDKVAVVV